MSKSEETLAVAEVDRWKMRVLVVEDDALVASHLATILRREGHDVEVTTDGTTALASIQAQSPDAILLDLGLPGMDGWELARQVMRMKGDKKPLLVAITGHGATEDRKRSLQAGIHLHLTKPVDIDELRRLLKRFRAIITLE